MKLAGCNQLARLLNRGRDAPKMRNAGNVVQAIQNLGYTNLARAADLGRAEVASGKRGLQAHLQDHGLDHFVDVRHIHNLLEIPGRAPAPAVNLLGQRRANVLDHLRGEVGPEEIGKQEAWQVHQLVRIGVPVVVRHTGRGHPHYLSSHMSQEACLVIVEGGRETNMGEEFQAENVLDTHLLRGARGP